MKTDGANAVQILLLVAGISLVPAMLFTLTGFTRILIVLGFIRSGMGTPTAPPNQVLVGIAFFLTIFVMFPTFSKINEDAIQPLRENKISQERAIKAAELPMRMDTLIACRARLMTVSSFTTKTTPPASG